MYTLHAYYRHQIIRTNHPSVAAAQEALKAQPHKYHITAAVIRSEHTSDGSSHGVRVRPLGSWLNKQLAREYSREYILAISNGEHEMAKTTALLETTSGTERVTRRGAAQCLRQWRAFGFQPKREIVGRWGIRHYQRRYVVDGAELHTFNL